MRLCSLEMQGFKSFPDKTRLEFNDGITAVVGPNGSGKSNIADAVRWVLGEQSSKTLRGDRMEDVIFNGTQNRKAVGYAAVDLTIDNSSGVLSEYDEKLTVGRRYYRSGESEYRINGSTVRLRDVHELFMDTGLGRDGYSIIGQGRISEIVSAKSTERREIFEEAAGIAKFRYRRTEAQRKLDAAQENLVRLYDILTELEDRVGPLKKQSEKAQKYLVLAQERKELEISIWVSSFDTLKEQIDAQKNKVLIAKNDYNNLTQATENIEAELAKTYDNMQQLSVAVDERRNSIKRLEQELSDGESSIAVLKNDMEHNNNALQRIQQELEAANHGNEQIKNLLKQKENQEKESAELVSRLDREIESLEQKQQDLSNELQQLSDVAEQIALKKSSVENSISKIRLEQAANDSLFSQIEERLENLRKTEAEHQKAEKETQQNIIYCEQEISEQQQVEQQLNAAKNELLTKREEKLSEFESLNAQRDKYLLDAQKAKARAKLLRDMESSMEGYFGSVKYVLNQSERGNLAGIHGAVSSLITTEPDYITAIETALGAAMQNIVVQDENAAKNAINSLKKARVGRATFLPMTSVSGSVYDFSHLQNTEGFIGNASQLVEFDLKYQGVINQLLGRICVVQNLDIGSKIARDNRYRFRIVTLDGQVINAGGSYTGGSTSRSSGVLGRRHEIKDLGKKYKELISAAKKFDPTMVELKDTIQELEKELSVADEKIQSGNEERVKLGLSKEQLERSLENTSQNLTLAKSEIEKLENRLQQLKDGGATATEFFDTSGKDISEFSKKLQSVELQKKELEQQTKLTASELSEIKMKQLADTKDHESLQQEIARIHLQIENSQAQKELLSKEQSNIELRNSEIAENILELENRKTQLVTEIEKHNNGIKQCVDERTALEKSTTEMRSQEREISSRREEVSGELARLEERQHRIQQEYDDIISKLWDEYELTRSNAEKIAKPVEDLVKSNARLAELRKKIRNLGSVNVAAVEEYKEVNERYTFLSEQVEDIEQSKDKLYKLIDDLTDEMQELFLDTFEQISIEFSKIFVELFGGGKAELVLSDAENILESGIEIKVQPPGKVIKNLSLLSGGEQSFVAIAIYFAILKVQPSPFVVLDEIEAALDDVNVIKFANYLRILCKQDIQFIAITHRRGTMEEADVLYGVTMQEEGVSKLLELNIQEIESKLGMGAELQ